MEVGEARPDELVAAVTTSSVATAAVKVPGTETEAAGLVLVVAMTAVVTALLGEPTVELAGVGIYTKHIESIF